MEANATAARAGLLVTARAYGGTRGRRPAGAAAGRSSPRSGSPWRWRSRLPHRTPPSRRRPADEEEEAVAHGDSPGAANSSPAGGVPANNVCVRFVLKKQCPFGQSFHLVGDHQALGVWDPLKAVALEWSDGHVWIVEKG
ncbi:hypothetical protein ACP4OV_030096 [Aristida adscensionis]